MRNSLRRLRKERRLSLREAGERLSIPFQTLANYEKTDNPLPVEVIQKARHFYDVSETELVEDETPLQEDAVPYRTGTLLLEILTSAEMELIKRGLLARMADATGDLYNKMHAALGEIGIELERRPKPTPAPSANFPLTDAELAASKEFVQNYDAGAAGHAKPESARSPGAGERHLRKAQPPRPSSGVARTERPTPEGKGQK